jgi:hypothetical protein
MNLGNIYGLVEAFNLVYRKTCFAWAETEILDSGVC